MKNKKIFQMISDPGHAWLEVPVDLLKTLGIERKITDFSYINGDVAYLEEDADFTTFMDACKRKRMPVTINEVYQKRTPIRGYKRYPGCD